MLLHGLHQQAHVPAVLAVDDGLRQDIVVVNRVKLLLQVLFQEVVLVNALDGRLQDVGLLLGEVDQLADILEVGRRLVESDAAVLLLDHESRFPEGVDVAVHRAGRDK